MRGLTLNSFARSDVAVGAVILGLGVVSYVLAGVARAPSAGAGSAFRAAGAAADLLPLAIGVTAIGVAAFVLGLLFPA